MRSSFFQIERHSQPNFEVTCRCLTESARFTLKFEMAVITDKPGQLGFLVANEEGAVVMSGGELENDERIASVIFNMVNVANKKLLLPAGSNENFTRISIHYDNHVYAVTLSNRRLHIVKKKYVPFDPVAA